jgi:copper transport protein
LIVVPQVRKSITLEGRTKASIVSIFIARFSAIPVTILGNIVITGPLLLYILESNLDLTLASLYGKALIVKLSLAGVMIGIGSYNQLFIQKQAYRFSVLTTAIGSQQSSTSIENKTYYNNIIKIVGKLRRKSKKEGLLTDSSSNHNNYGNNNNNKNINPTNEKAYHITSFAKSTKVEAIVGLALLAAVVVLVNIGLPASEFQNYLHSHH